jgi:hypothetical protein
MKVFKFNTVTGTKGEQVADISRPDATGAYVYNDAIKVPTNTANTKWAVIQRAEDRRGNEIKFDFPVCFCTGEWFAGSDSSWEWYVLLPKKGV